MKYESRLGIIYHFSETVEQKLKQKHVVSPSEVIECFENRDGKFAYDTRDEHQTNPPSLWFIAETKAGRRLKVVFLRYSKIDYVVKSAFEPNADEERLYRAYKNQG
jgi:hypothetical protein